jgi:hypothetical protein
LKNGGVLYIGIENALSYRYLTGYPEDHSRLKYASLLPKQIANLYSLLVKGQPYRTYTYSLSGYKTMLKQAGFSKFNFYLPHPDYRFFTSIVPLENKRLLKYYVNNFSHIKLKGLASTLIDLNIFPYLVYSYSIFAHKDSKSYD